MDAVALFLRIAGIGYMLMIYLLAFLGNKEQETTLVVMAILAIAHFTGAIALTKSGKDGK